MLERTNKAVTLEFILAAKYAGKATTSAMRFSTLGLAWCCLQGARFFNGVTDHVLRDWRKYAKAA